MSEVVLVLGPVVFQDFEIPGRIDFGGSQRIAVHDLPGGGRVVDTLGPVPADVSWSGIFTGPDATDRALLLDGLRGQAVVLTLSWDVFFYSVLISSFQAEYQNTAWVPYSLRCIVVQDSTVFNGADADALTDILGDVTAAAGYAALSGLSLAMLQTSISMTGATLPGTGAYLNATDAFGAALNSTQGGLEQADSALSNYAGGFSNGGDVTAIIYSAGQAATLASSNAFLSRAAANLFNASI